MTRALLVAAVSTADKGQTCESQLKPLREIASRKGWEVVSELPFNQSRWDDESAAEVRSTILSDVAKGGIDVLAVWAWDRVSRRGVEEAFSFLRTLEDHHAVRFFSLQEPFLCTEADRQQRELMLAILAWTAKWESQRKSERVRARVQSKRAAAAKIGQAPKWGRGKLPTDSQLETVAIMRSEGMTVRAVAAATGLSKSAVARVPFSPKGQNENQGENYRPAEG